MTPKSRGDLKHPRLSPRLLARRRFLQHSLTVAGLGLAAACGLDKGARQAPSSY